MKKNNIIKKNYEINKVLNSNNKFSNKYFSIYKDSNNLNKYRFAICVSKKLGNAVTRNKIKRQVKDIIDKSNFVFKTNEDYVIIIKKEINNINFEDRKTNLLNLISKVID